MGNRGFLGNAIGLLVGAGSAALILMVLIFVGYTLSTSLGNANATLFWNNIVTGFNNFGTQFGTVGTILGVALILLVIGGGALLGYRAYKGRGGGGSGM